MRDALTIQLNGLVLHGTSHVGPARGKIGILFLNSGAQPRCSRGDLNVHLADSLAERGFPCFRVDLPGLGDSQGEAPREYHELYVLVQEGAHAAYASSLVQELRQRYALDGIVLTGVCGGAVTSVFAAAREPDVGVAGLMLFDLPFFLYRCSNPVSRKQSNSIWNRATMAVSRLKVSTHDWVIEQSWEPYATAFYYRMKTIATMARPRGLPPNTNIPLVQALSKVLDQDTPALILTAHPPTPEPACFDYIGFVARRSRPGLQHVKIHGTTHSFVENGGPKAVLQAICSWLTRFEPRGLAETSV